MANIFCLQPQVDIVDVIWFRLQSVDIALLPLTINGTLCLSRVNVIFNVVTAKCCLSKACM